MPPPGSRNPRSGATERRAYERHPTRLPAELLSGGDHPLACTIRDWCRGGLLVELPSGARLPAESGATRIRCLPGDGEGFVLPGTVVRVDGPQLGFAFVEPPVAMLDALERAAASAHVGAGNTAGGPRPPEADSLLERCSARVREAVAPLGTAFFNSLEQELRDREASGADFAGQQALLELLTRLKTEHGGLRSGFEAAIEARLQTAGQAPVRRTAEPMGARSEGLALVEDEQLNTWLAVGEIATAVHTANKVVLGQLDQRLSVLLGVAVDESNNPYGPLLFADAFAEALHPFQLAGDMQGLCYRALKKTLMAVARGLYADLDTLLVEAGVLPHLKYEILKERELAARRASETAAPEASPPAGQPGSDAMRESSAAAPGAGSGESAVGGAGPGQHKSAAPSATDAAPGPALASAARREGAAQAAARPDLYQVSGGLRELQAHFRSHFGRGAQAASPAANAEVHTEATQRPTGAAELVRLLSDTSIQRRLAAHGARGLREHIEAALAAHTGEAGAIAPREGRVIDVTGDVFAALLQDPQLAPGVRPWVQRLELPVLRLALLDEGVFAEPDHVVRRLLDKVAQLELLAAEDLRQRATIRRALEWLLNVLDKEFDGTTDVFRRVAAQLDILLRAQQDTFERNVRATVNEFVHEEKALPAPEPTPADEEDTWLRRVRRLQEGHWVLFDAGEESQRLKVAWVAPRTRKYVFVTALGKKARVESEAPLAALLREGKAVLLDDADAPAMDRAQFAMLQKLHRQLLYQAAHDQATGLLNRREFEQRLDAALMDAKVTDARHALCFVAVDQVKMVTGSRGYQAADELMRELAERLQADIGEHGELGRLESDAFGLLLCRHSIDEALEAIEDLMDKLHGYRFSSQEERISISLSVGVAPLTARSEDRETLLQAAASSAAMAREMGGGRVQVYYSQGAGLSRRREEMRWAARIDRALDEGGLYLRCQKIMPVAAGPDLKPHYELLLGLADELGGNAELEAFVRAAESSGRMSDVDRWVIRNAFEWISAHQDALQGIGSFSVNLSGLSLNGETLFDFIAGELRRTGVPVEKICFEVTETAGISNLSDAAEFIRAVKDLGCRFSLDDFGSGMSSYAYLKNLPVDYLKIDGAFIRDIAENSEDYAMAKSICDIGHFLGKAVVAEYVHNAATFELVREFGADFAQGFGVERPRRLSDLLEA